MIACSFVTDDGNSVCVPLTNEGEASCPVTDIRVVNYDERRQYRGTHKIIGKLGNDQYLMQSSTFGNNLPIYKILVGLQPCINLKSTADRCYSKSEI